MSDLPRSAGVVIVGGGVIGLAVARALAQRGLNDVVLIERGSLGAESSSAAAGMLALKPRPIALTNSLSLSARVATCIPPSQQPCWRKQA